MTLEAWVCLLGPIRLPLPGLPGRPIPLPGWGAGVQDILAHGHAPSCGGREVFLRVRDGHYEVGSCDESGTRLAAFKIPAADSKPVVRIGPFSWGRWVHLAGVYDGECWRLYRDGVEVAATFDETGAVSVPDTHWNVGASTTGKDPRYFYGGVDDVRIWSTGRTADQIRACLGDHLAEPENEIDLVGNWCGDHGIRDRSRYESACRQLGKIEYPAVTFPEVHYASDGIWPVAEVNGLEVRAAIPLRGWSHVAATYEQSYALRLNGAQHLECSDDPSIDIPEDLTLEVFGSIDRFGPGVGLLVKGGAGRDAEQQIPYALTVSRDGRLQLSFQDETGRPHTFTAEKSLEAGVPFRVAVSRERLMATVEETFTVIWHQVELHVKVGNRDTHTTTRHYLPHQVAEVRDGIPRLKPSAKNERGLIAPPGIGRGAAPLFLGRSYTDLADEGSAVTLEGCLSEVRIWNETRTGITDRVTGDESGPRVLVAVRRANRAQRV